MILSILGLVEKDSTSVGSRGLLFNKTNPEYTALTKKLTKLGVDKAVVKKHSKV